jgi:hypothetical protein
VKSGPGRNDPDLRSSLWSADFYTIGVPSVELLPVRPREAHCIYLAFAGKVGSIICVGGSFDSAWTNPILCTCCKHRRDKWTVILSTRTPPILEHADVHPIRTAQRYIWPWSYSSVHWLSVLLPLHAAATASTQTHKIVLALRFTYS